MHSSFDTLAVYRSKDARFTLQGVVDFGTVKFVNVSHTDSTEMSLTTYLWPLA
jgi:hypothetical protein